MNIPKLGVAVSSLLVLAFTACGGTPAAPKAQDYSAIEGNWHLTGQGSFPDNLSQAPVLTLAIGRSGNTIHATGYTIVPCSQSATWLGGQLKGVGQPISGDIAVDGTFLLTNASDPLSPIQFAIHGNAAPTGSSSWSGTYTLSNAPSSLLRCDFNLSGIFTATAYPPFHGTYSGTITGTGFESGTPITLQVAQGEPTIVPGGQLLFSGLTFLTRFYIPLSGTITVSGSPCFTTGTFASDGNSTLAGNRFTILATMNTGTPVFLTGLFSDQSETTLASVQLDVMDARGSCANAFGNGSLVLQQ
jgi:hypothetical protein